MWRNCTSGRSLAKRATQPDGAIRYRRRTLVRRRGARQLVEPPRLPTINSLACASCGPHAPKSKPSQLTPNRPPAVYLGSNLLECMELSRTKDRTRQECADKKKRESSTSLWQKRLGKNYRSCSGFSLGKTPSPVPTGPESEERVVIRCMSE